MPIVPMLSDYFLTTSPLSMTEEERANLAGMRASWKALAQVMDQLVNVWFSLLWRKTFFYGVLQSQCASSTSNFQDLDADWDSPLLFPDKASKELLAALPPTVVISAEFDMFITGSVLFKKLSLHCI